MPADIYIDVPSPFGLSRPTRAWCDVIAAFDPDLRIFPSQTHPLYRLMRRAYNTPMSAVMDRMHKAMAAGTLKEVHPDTKIAINHGLVAVSTLPKEIVTISPERIVQNLMGRDQWAHKDGDAVADALDQRDADAERELDRQLHADVRKRRREAGISLRYRTGARVSLVNPSRRGAGEASLETPGADNGATVSPTE
jgi:hypothetical protein